MDICSCRADYFNCLPDRGTPGIREGNNPCSQSSSIYRRLYRRATPLKPSQIVALINNQISDTLEVNSLHTAQNPEEAWMVSFKNAGRRQLSINLFGRNKRMGRRKFFLPDCPQIASLATGCSCSERNSVNRKNHCRHKYPAHGGYSDIRFSNLVAP